MKVRESEERRGRSEGKGECQEKNRDKCVDTVNSIIW